MVMSVCIKHIEVVGHVIGMKLLEMRSASENRHMRIREIVFQNKDGRT